MANILPPVGFADFIFVAILLAIIISAFIVRRFIEKIDAPVEDADTRDHLLHTWEQNGWG